MYRTQFAAVAEINVCEQEILTVFLLALRGLGLGRPIETKSEELPRCDECVRIKI